MRTPAWFLVLALAGCGSTFRTSTDGERTSTERGVSNRSFTGHCAATYEAEDDITLVVVPLYDEVVVDFVLPGDGWEGACGPDAGRQALFRTEIGSLQLAGASHEAARRMATVTVDLSVIGPVDVAAYAHAQSARTLEALVRHGVHAEGAVEMMGGNTYVLTYSIDDEPSHPLLQVNAYHVLPTQDGLLRYHLSETGRDAAALSASAPTLLDAARAFGPIRAD